MGVGENADTTDTRVMLDCRAEAEFKLRPFGRLLALAFLLYGLIGSGFVALNLPPWQNPDEPAHFMRAFQISEGQPLDFRFSEELTDGGRRMNAGGQVDSGILDAVAPFVVVGFQPDRKIDRTMWNAASWSGQQVNAGFANTVNYPPFLYLPASAAILAGRGLGLDVFQTLTFARVLTATVAVVAGAAAIAIAGPAAPWLFAILSLPMSLALMGSVSQDGLMLGATALAVALLSYGAVDEDRARATSYWLAVALLAVVGMARPPYACLAIIALVAPGIALRQRLSGMIIVAVAAVGWSAIAAATTAINFAPAMGKSADPVGQILRLREAPIDAAVMVFETVRQLWSWWLASFIGILGWLDAPLPRWYYPPAAGMLTVAFLVAAPRASLGQGARAVVALGCAGAVGGVLLVQFLTWTDAASPVIEGIQGRYFLPIALVLLLARPQLPMPSRVQAASKLFLLMFPIISLAVLMRTVILRYYLT